MKVAQKNALNMNMPSIHLFACRIISNIGRVAFSPHMHVEYFGLRLGFPAPLNIELAHTCHVNAMLINI